MADVTSFSEKARRARRERGNWTVEDERKWLEDHPDDEPKFDVGHVTLPTDDDVEHDADLVPDLGQDERSEEDRAIDAVIARVGIIEAYNRWSGKGTVETKGKREGIKVRCPNPAHPDHNPSAWLNTDKDVWVCGGCGMEGGDKFDIAAWHFGMPVPAYKGEQFPELRRRMANDLGLTVVKGISGKTHVVSSDDEQPAHDRDDADDAQDVRNASHDDGDAPHEQHEQPEQDDDDTPSNVVNLTPGHQSDVEDALFRVPAIDWRALVPADTFLDLWMRAVTVDDLPEEYYFWLGLQAIGLGIGHDTGLEDVPPVYGNLYIVLVGGTGVGKSKSIGHLTRLLREAIPYDESDPNSKGTRIVSNPSSAEALLDKFVRIEQPEDDPIQYFPVRGLVKFAEMGDLIDKSSRVGNPIKFTAMELYDSYDTVEQHSRGHGSIRAVEPFCSMVTTTQPASIRENLKMADARSGFGNRWVYVVGRGKPHQPFGTHDPDMDPVVAALRGLRAHYANKNTVPWTSEARDVFSEWFFRVVAPRKGNDDDFAPMMARADLTIKKLVLLLAVNRKERKASAQTITDAISLWGYLEATYKYVTKEIGAGPAKDAERRIIQILTAWKEENRKRPPSARDLIRACGQNYDTGLLRNMLKIMVDVGMVEESTYKNPKGGPATTVYEYVE